MVAGLVLACAAPEPPPPPPPPPPDRGALAAAAVDRALEALDRLTADPAAVTRMDALLAVEAIRRLRPGPAVDALRARLVPRVDTGNDPRRRCWDPTASWPAGQDYTWTPSAGPDQSPNLVFVEALYCDQHPLRPETVAWACANLRDDGGRRSGHAAWYLDLAVDRGCVPRADTCLDALRDELVAAALRPATRDDTDAHDLLAEQVLFALLAGAPASGLDPAVDALLAAQAPDGSFGATGDASYPAQHATAAGAWALTEWLAAR